MTKSIPLNWRIGMVLINKIRSPFFLSDQKKPDKAIEVDCEFIGLGIKSNKKSQVRERKAITVEGKNYQIKCKQEKEI